MPDFLTRTEVAAIAKRAVKSIPESRIDPESIDKRGSTMNILVVGAGGALVEEVQRRAYAKIAALTRKGARGDELDAVIYEQTFGEVYRLEAKPAVVTVEISRSQGGLPGGKIDAGTVALAGNVAFTLDTTVPIASGQKGPLKTTVTAKVAGTATNVPKGALNGWESAGSLFDPNLQIVSIENASGGEDRELDEAFVARSETWAQSVRRGILDAIERAAVQVGGVRQAVVVESMNTAGEPAGPVVVHIADSFGQANEALCLRVLRSLRAARCGGIPVRVVGSIPSYQAIVLSPSYLDGFNIPQTQAQARALVVASVNRTLPNKPLERSLLFAAMRATPGLSVGAGAVVTPATDIAPPLGQSIKTREDLVTFA